MQLPEDIIRKRSSHQLHKEIKQSYDALMDVLQFDKCGRAMGHARTLYLKVKQLQYRDETKRSTDA